MESLVLNAGTVIVPIEVIVVTVNQLHMGDTDAVLQVVNIVIPPSKTIVEIFSLTRSVLVKHVPSVAFGVCIVVHDRARPDSDIALLIDAVAVAVNLIPGHDVLAATKVRRSFIILDAFGITIPLTGNQLAVFFKLVGHVAIVQGGNRRVSGLIKIVPLVVDLDPSGVRRSAGEVIVFAVNDLQAIFNMAFPAADAADLLAVLEDIAVAVCRDRRAPFHNGVTGFAESTAGVAFLDAGGLFIRNRDSRMNMRRTVFRQISLINRSLVGVHLRIHMELLVGEGACVAVSVRNQALIHIQLHILREEVIGRPIGFRRIAGHMDIIVKIQNTDGDLSQNRRAGLIIVAGALEGNLCRIGLFRNGVARGEALGKHHMIQLPVVHVIQVNHSRNRLDRLNRVGLQIHPVDRTKRNPVKRCVRRNEAQC